MHYFDFHCHLDVDDLNGQREHILHEIKTRPLGACTIGVDADSSRRAVAIATGCENIWCCVGQHPVDNRSQSFQSQVYQELIDAHPDQIVGVGECGLDYYWPTKDVAAGKMTAEELAEEKKRQALVFRQNITLAIANDLPLMLHVRSSEGTVDAHRDALDILGEYENLRAVFHFYTEGAELAQEIVGAGYYISLPGVITFGNKVAELEEAVRTVPLDRMFAETDSPYAAPAPYRGQTNTPLYVEEVYKKIAELRGVELDEVREQILSNVEEFFGVSLGRSLPS